MRDIYLLLANQLNDLYHRLSIKVLENKQRKPLWEITLIPQKNSPPIEVVNDLSEIKSLIFTLERLAGTGQQQTTDFVFPGENGGENGE